MLYWLLQQYGSAVESLAGVSTGDSRVFLTARIALATLVSFVTALIFGPHAIRWLKERFRERIVSASEKLNELHAGKRDTPTMGGIFIVLAIVVATAFCGDLSNRSLRQSLRVVIGFGARRVWKDRPGLVPALLVLALGSTCLFALTKLPTEFQRRTDLGPHWR